MDFDKFGFSMEFIQDLNEENNEALNEIKEKFYLSISSFIKSEKHKAIDADDRERELSLLTKQMAAEAKTKKDKKKKVEVEKEEEEEKIKEEIKEEIKKDKKKDKKKEKKNYTQTKKEFKKATLDIEEGSVDDNILDKIDIDSAFQE